MALSIVEREYIRVLKPQLRDALREGNPKRAALLARELAKLRRRAKMPSNTGRNCRRCDHG